MAGLAMDARRSGIRTELMGDGLIHRWGQVGFWERNRAFSLDFIWEYLSGNFFSNFS
jgi:hypothetical protein